jgi:hypothetical protein
MAKQTFSKLNLKINNSISTIIINDIEIEVKKYLPMNEKIELVANVINAAADDNNFANPMKLEIFTALEIIYAYTNLSFTEKQKEDPAKLYDLLLTNGVISEVSNRISDEKIIIEKYVTECANAIYTYRNSILGLLETISADYSNLDLNAADIQQKLADPENMALLKSILTKLG